METPQLKLKIKAKEAEMERMWRSWWDFKRLHERLIEIDEAGIPEELEEEWESNLHYYNILGIEFGFWTREQLEQ